MDKRVKVFGLFIVTALLLLLTVQSLGMTGLFKQKTQGYTYVIPISVTPHPSESKLQLHTFPFITTTPVPTNALPTDPPRLPTIFPTKPAGSTIPVTQPKIGGAQPATSDLYCIDDVDPDMCDDQTAHLVPKGVGGVTGTCGTVISQTHKLVNALPQYMKGLRDFLTTSVTNCNYTTGPTNKGSYLSTYLAIDSYNLAGFKEMNKSLPDFVSPSSLLAWWKTAPGYKFIPYTPSVIQQWANGQQDLTGCVMFFKGGHIGIVNKFEIFTPGGDGVISILQASYNMYIDRFPVAGYNVDSASTNQTNTSGIDGFGCH